MKIPYLLILVLAVAGSAQEAKRKPETKSGTGERPTHSKMRPVPYVPPKVNAPKITTGPGTRSNHGPFRLDVAAPDHTGLTISEQPTLYWFQSGNPTAPLEVTIATPGVPDPLLRITSTNQSEQGRHEIDLAQHNLRLQPGIEYRWSIAMVVDAQHRSKDTVATGSLMRTIPDEKMLTDLRAATKEDQLRICARAGLWYDAFHLAVQLLARSPEEEQWQEQMTLLKHQIGLTNVADGVAAIR